MSAHRELGSAGRNAMALFPSIRPGCLRVLTLEGSDTLPLRQELESLGLWQRAVMQVSKRDAEGGLAGCWRAFPICDCAK